MHPSSVSMSYKKKKFKTKQKKIIFIQREQTSVHGLRCALRQSKARTFYEPIFQQTSSTKFIQYLLFISFHLVVNTIDRLVKWAMKVMFRMKCIIQRSKTIHQINFVKREKKYKVWLFNREAYH